MAPHLAMILILLSALTGIQAFEVEVGQLTITFPDETFLAFLVRDPKPKYVLAGPDDSGAAVTRERHMTSGGPLAMVTVMRLQTDPAKDDWWCEYHQYFIDDLQEQGLVTGFGTRDEVTTASGLKGQRVKFGPVTTEEVSGNL